MSRRRALYSTLFLCGLAGAIVLGFSWNTLSVRHHVALLKAAEQDFVALNQGKPRMTVGRFWRAVLGRTGNESTRTGDSYQQEQKALLQLGWLVRQEFVVANWNEANRRRAFYSAATNQLADCCCWSYAVSTSGTMTVTAPTNSLARWKEFIADFNSKSNE